MGRCLPFGRQIAACGLLRGLQLVALVLCGLTLGWPVPLAVAAEPSAAVLERADAKAIEAKAFFQAGLYEQAAESFLQAFAISRKPDMVFNAARAHEQAGKSAQAVALFEMYLKLPDAKDDGKASARERIAKLKAAQPALEPAKPAPPLTVPPSNVTPPVVLPQPATSTAAPSEVRVQPMAQVPSPPPRSTAVSVGLVVGGGVLVLAALGSWADAVKQVQDANAMDFSVPNAAATYRNRIDAAQTQRNGDVVLGLAGAGLAGWGVWRLWGPAPKTVTASTRWWWQPTVSTTGAHVALGGNF